MPSESFLDRAVYYQTAGVAVINVEQILLEIAVRERQIARLQAERDTWIHYLSQLPIGIPESRA